MRPLTCVLILATWLHWFHNSAWFQFNRKWFSYCRVGAETQQWSPWEQWWWTDWLFTDSHWPASSEAPPIWRHCQQQRQMERAVCAWYKTPQLTDVKLKMLCAVHKFLPMNIEGRWFFMCPVTQTFLCVYCAQSLPIRSKRKWSRMSTQTSKPMSHPLTASLMDTSLTNHRSQAALLQWENTTTSVQTTCMQITRPGMVQTWYRVHPKSLTLHPNTITGIFTCVLVRPTEDVRRDTREPLKKRWKLRKCVLREIRQPFLLSIMWHKIHCWWSQLD